MNEKPSNVAESNLVELVELVDANQLEKIVTLSKQVRTAQKRYFKTRERADLIRSKELEAELDRVLSDNARPVAPEIPKSRSTYHQCKVWERMSALGLRVRFSPAEFGLSDEERETLARLVEESFAELMAGLGYSIEWSRTESESGQLFGLTVEKALELQSHATFILSALGIPDAWIRTLFDELAVDAAESGRASEFNAIDAIAKIKSDAKNKAAAAN